MKRYREKTLPANIPLFFFICQPTSDCQLDAIRRSAKDAITSIRDELVGMDVTELHILRGSTLFASYYSHLISFGMADRPVAQGFVGGLLLGSRSDLLTATVLGHVC
jgi:hypothetical protein